MLRRNGFVVLANVNGWSLPEGYLETWPGFITADSVLYLFHCVFLDGLSKYEKENLVPLTRRLVDAGLADAQRDYGARRSDPLLAEPARRNVVFFSVADALVTGKAPRAEQAEAAPLVAKIKAANHAGFYPDEDFTVYEPRGAYAEDPELGRYFRATKWLSRQILPILPGAADKHPDAEIKLRQAWLLGKMLEADPSLRATWQKLYEEVSFFIARPDSFTPVELVEATRSFGDRPDDAWIAAVRAELAKPKYPASRIMPVPQNKPGDAPCKYVQFLGERFIPDGQIMQETCYPYNGRILPSGLDVGYALFDSDRAFAALGPDLNRYPDLGPELRNLHASFGTYGHEARPTSIYGGWVDAIREEAKPPTSTALPAFFRSEAWSDKCLTTTLAAWTEMRHDYILYAKEPAIPGAMNITALVEPVPAVYDRLQKLCAKLSKRGFGGAELLGNLCSDLKAVADAELRGKMYYRGFGAHLKDASALALYAEWMLKLAREAPLKSPCIVADVCTSSFQPHPVLHEATGPFNLVVARVGKQIFSGWVLSYYEDIEPNFKRLTDAEWRKKARRGEISQYRPAWVDSYMYGEH